MDIGDTRGLFKAGRCGLLIEWGDPGPMSDEEPDASAIKDKLFAISALGTKEVLDRATGKLVPVTKENAPYAIDGINYAPFAAFGGWVFAINAKIDAKKQQAAYDFTVLHEPGRPIEPRRDHRLDRLSTLSSVADLPTLITG